MKLLEMLKRDCDMKVVHGLVIDIAESLLGIGQISPAEKEKCKAKAIFLIKIAKEMDLFLVPYESKNGMEDTKTALSQIKSGMSVGILIGPEGGFDEKEVELAFENGGKVVSLGKRILRTETAAITSVSMCMLHAEMYLGEYNEAITNSISGENENSFG